MQIFFFLSNRYLTQSNDVSCTYVGLQSCRLREHGFSRFEQICWNMLNEAAHFENSNLFLQSEPVTERERERKNEKKYLKEKVECCA